MTCEHYQDLVAPHVDGVLSPTERQDVEQHLTACPRCQHLFREGQLFHRQLSTRRLMAPVPREVERRLRAALWAEEHAGLSLWGRVRALFAWPRLALATAAAGVLLAFFTWQFFSAAGPPAVLAAVEQYRAAAAGQMQLAYKTDDARALEALLNRSGKLDFAAHILDLRAAGYRLKGAQVVQIENHPVVVTVYEGADGPLVCLRRRGRAPGPPPGSEGTGETFVMQHAGHTLSFVQYPDYYCLMIARLPRDAFKRRLGLA